MTIAITKIFTLLVLFQVKHFFADYVLQTDYMLQKGKERDWELPLLAHVTVHGVFTLVLTFIFGSWWLAILLALTDMFIHFVMDRLKASPNYLGRYKALGNREFGVLEQKTVDLTVAMNAAFRNAQTSSGDLIKAVHERSVHMCSAKKQKFHNKLFWICLGFDQLIHHLTDILFVYIIATH